MLARCYHKFIRNDSEVYVEYYSMYGHLFTVFVSYGQTVKRGQLIGLSGENYGGLPHFKLRGKILVRLSEFDQWIETFRVDTKQELNNLVDDVLTGLKG